MRIHEFLSLVQSSHRFLIVHRSLIFHPHRCNIHRTICHHARRSALRVAGASVSAPAHLEQTRGKKTQLTLKLKDLPQGALKLEPYNDTAEDDTPQYPTVIQQHRNNMQKFRNCVLLTRVGGFYEVRFETSCLFRGVI